MSGALTWSRLTPPAACPPRAPLTVIAVEALVIAAAGAVAAAVLTLAGFSVRDHPALFGAGFGLLAVPAYLLAGRLGEGLGAAALGLPRRPLWLPLVLGLLLGASLIGATIAILALGGQFAVHDWSDSAPLALLVLLPAAILDALWQEILARAIAFRHLEAWLGSWLAIAASTAFFALIHLSAPHATLASCIAIGLQAGPLLAAAFMLTRNLWFVAGIHAGWNFAGQAIFGVTISGNQPTAHLIDQTTHGDALWTGGVFGPEGGVVATSVCLLAGVLLLALAARRGRVQAGGAGMLPLRAASSR